MRITCYISGGCRWLLLKEEWIDPTKTRPYSQLVRFHECKYCGDTKATLTSPDSLESRFSIPDRFSLPHEAIP